MTRTLGLNDYLRLGPAARGRVDRWIAESGFSPSDIDALRITDAGTYERHVVLADRSSWPPVARWEPFTPATDFPIPLPEDTPA